MWRTATRAGRVALLLALAMLAAPTGSSAVPTAEQASERSSTQDVLIAVPRDLGTGDGTWSRADALAGRVVVGRVEGAGGSGGRLFQLDLDAPGGAMRALDDGGLGLSMITDADGPYVVGSHQAGTASTSGFVFDLRTQTSTSLGLGGWSGQASAVNGGVVVGSGSLHDVVGPTHAFAFDADGARIVQDLGTLGGQGSHAAGVSGTIVVGRANLADGSTHAFAVDLLAPGRPMTDLGTLGGDVSTATDVAGDLVVGDAQVADGSVHAFAVRLPVAGSVAPAPMLDLGTLGGGSSRAVAVDGSVVVGTSTRADGSTGSWWTDVSTLPIVLHDLGTTAGSLGVDDGMVYGTRETPAGERGFVHVLATGATVDLEPLPGSWRTTAVDVSAGLVVGTSSGTEVSHAVAWTLTTVHAPSFRLSRSRPRASEGTRARIEVIRDGDLRDEVAVRYRVRTIRGGAIAGKDFRGARGTVVFRPGQTRGVIRVWIRDDRLREGRERARVRLAVTPGTSVGVPRKGYLVIRASDRRS